MKNMKRNVLMGILGATLAAGSVLAQESGTANTAVTTAMQTTANDMLATGNAIVPIALTVVGLALVVRFGLKMFRSVGK